MTAWRRAVARMSARGPGGRGDRSRLRPSQSRIAARGPPTGWPPGRPSPLARLRLPKSVPDSADFDSGSAERQTRLCSSAACSRAGLRVRTGASWPASRREAASRLLDASVADRATGGGVRTSRTWFEGFRRRPRGRQEGRRCRSRSILASRVRRLFSLATWGLGYWRRCSGVPAGSTKTRLQSPCPCERAPRRSADHRPESPTRCRPLKKSPSWRRGTSPTA